MTNHVHLLMTSPTTSGAGELMKHSGQRYVQYVNRTYHRSGTLWEGRFRSCLTREEDYVLGCHRYIELNPVLPGGRLGCQDQPDQAHAQGYHHHRGVADMAPP